MSEQLDLLESVRDHLESVIAAQKEKQAKMDIELTLSIALDALTRALPYVRHDGPRAQIVGAREQVKKLLRNAA